MEKTELLSLLRKKGYSKDIVRSFEVVRREDFLPVSLSSYAYEDIALPISSGSTISQPSTIAFMFQLLDIHINERILEIGSGTGYVLALLSRLNGDGDIHGIEIDKQLAAESRERFKETKRISIHAMDGKNGLVDFAPYDKILISAECKELPTHLVDQLSKDGVIVAPVGNSIVRMRRQGDSIQTEEFPGYVFVPMK